MAFIDVYNASQNEDFQGRCLAAIWVTAQHVLAGTAGYNVSVQSKNFALKLLRRQATISPEQIAVQVLRNSVIAGNVSGSLDSDIDWQIKDIWADLMDIG